MSGTKTLLRCRNNKEADNVVLIDVDSEHFDNVIIIDVPEPLSKKWLGSSTDRKKEKWPFRTVICIDDDESTDNDQNDDHRQNVNAESKNAQHKEPPVCSSNGKTSHGNEAPSPFIRQEDDHFDSTSYGYSKSDGPKRSHSGAKDPPFNYAEQKNSQHYAPVSLSCQNEGSLNPSASSYSPYHVQGTEQVDHPTMAFQDDEEIRMNSFHGKHSLAEEEDPMCKRQNSYETDSDYIGSSLTDKEKKLQESFTGNNKEEHLEPHQPRATSNVNKENLINTAAHLRQDNSSFEAMENLVDSVSKSMHEDEDDQKNIQNGGTTRCDENFIIIEREKLKETDEYKRAQEVEWASRQQALKTQAEESQRLRQLQKRRKAESTRLQEMAKRQKLRVDEVRETQKKDVENINLKEVMRSQVRKELKKLEMACSNMASLLHSLGIQVGSWPCPSPDEVQAAYKRALLKFHPDRAPQFDIRKQVEAEEKFKLINRLKEKLLPSL